MRTRIVPALLLVCSLLACSDDTDPSIRVSAPGGVLPLGDPVTIELVVHDEESSFLFFDTVSGLQRATVTIPGTAFAHTVYRAGTHPFQWTPTQGGQFAVQGSAWDNDGNVASASSVLTIETARPALVTGYCDYVGRPQDDFLGLSVADVLEALGVTDLTPAPQMQAAVNRIMELSGLPAESVRLIAAPRVGNAAAWVADDVRYIGYNPSFMEGVNRTTGTNWGAVSVLAHEVGHHLPGHTIDGIGSRPATELQADFFSGYVLCRMGASELEATATARTVLSREGSATHPPRDDRVSSIVDGCVSHPWGWSGPPTQDTMVDTQTPDTNWGDLDGFDLWDEDGEFSYGLLQFDLSVPIADGLSVGNIFTAKLTFRSRGDTGTITASVIDGPWDEMGVTWNTFRKDVGLGNPVGRYPLPLNWEELTEDRAMEFTIDVTDAVKEWLRGPDHGLALAINPADGDTALLAVNSRESRPEPVLLVQWQP
jgi:hypothetical protein